jgi:hypothetical protein
MLPKFNETIKLDGEFKVCNNDLCTMISGVNFFKTISDFNNQNQIIVTYFNPNNKNNFEIGLLSNDSIIQYKPMICSQINLN